MIGIYCIENMINHKKYVGKSPTSIEDRALWINEATENPKYLRNDHLTNAVNKYGISNFRAYVLEECTINVINDRERYWIQELHTYCKDPLCQGYNMTKGGDGVSGYSYERTEEIRRKNSEALIGRRMPEEVKIKISKKLIGLTPSEETRKKLSDAGKQRVMSEESKRKISESHRGNKMPKNIEYHHRCTICNTEFIGTSSRCKYCPDCISSMDRYPSKYDWYSQQKDKMILSENTRNIVEKYIEYFK